MKIQAKLGSGRSTVRKCTGPKWSKMVLTTILVKMPLFRTGFSIRETKMDQNGPFWSILVHFGLKRSILVHSGPPTVLWPFLKNFEMPRGPCDRKNSIPIENFNPGLKVSISIENFNLEIENFNPAVFLFTGPSWCFREGLDRTFQSMIDRSKFSIPKAAIEFFQSLGPLGVQ